MFRRFKCSCNSIRLAVEGSEARVRSPRHEKDCQQLRVRQSFRTPPVKPLPRALLFGPMLDRHRLLTTSKIRTKTRKTAVFNGHAQGHCIWQLEKCGVPATIRLRFCTSMLLVARMLLQDTRRQSRWRSCHSILPSGLP